MVDLLLNKIKNDPELYQEAQRTLDDYVEHVNIYLEAKLLKQTHVNGLTPDLDFMEEIERYSPEIKNSDDFRRQFVMLAAGLFQKGSVLYWETSPLNVGIAAYVSTPRVPKVKAKKRYRQITDPWEQSW